MIRVPAEIIDFKVLWRNVATARGTRAPGAPCVDAFLIGLSVPARQGLLESLTRCRKGSEINLDIETVSWASACTHPPMLAKALEAGLQCTAPALFEAGLSLMFKDGVDPGVFVMHLKDDPAKVAILRNLLPEQQFAESLPAHVNEPELTATKHVFTPEDVGVELFEASNPVDKTRPSTGSFVEPYPNAESVTSDSTVERTWASVRLFGQTAAHTLEISKHRRAGQFLGVNVVGIESAWPNGRGGFDWGQKLSIQLTPEEMPEAIAVLLGIVKEATFANHGADRNKSVTFRNQPGGLMVVTSMRSATYAVPVKTSVTYYLLDLFCRAMAEGHPGRKAPDVIALVRGIY